MVRSKKKNRRTWKKRSITIKKRKSVKKKYSKNKFRGFEEYENSLRHMTDEQLMKEQQDLIREENKRNEDRLEIQKIRQKLVVNQRKQVSSNTEPFADIEEKWRLIEAEIKKRKPWWEFW